MRHDEDAQVHILEMLTLFWLFFMSATFLIRIQVPDAPSVAHDAELLPPLVHVGRRALPRLRRGRMENSGHFR